MVWLQEALQSERLNFFLGDFMKPPDITILFSKLSKSENDLFLSNSYYRLCSEIDYELT